MIKNRRFADDDDNRAPAFGRRHLQCVLLFFSLFVAFTSRVNLSVAIVAMTTTSSMTNSNSAENQKELEFAWSEKIKSMVLGSFFWGYFVTQIPGGQLAHMFGSKILILQCLLFTSILTLLTPLAVKYGGWKLLCAFRVVQGLSQGVLYPSGHTLISRWAPAKERATLSTLSYQGAVFGTVFMLAISGALASSTYGWPSIFYVSGAMCFLAAVALYIWGASSPNDCKFITAAEKSLIEASPSKTQGPEESHSALKTPWKSILTSMPFWVLALVHCANNYGFWTLLTQIPSYMYHVMGVDIKNNALISSLPYVAVIFLGYTFCGMSALLQKRHCLSLTASRKLFTTISLWIPMLSIIALGYVSGDHVQVAVILLIITVGVNSAALVGFYVNHIDLSPNFGGILMGLTCFGANFMGVVAPMVVGFIVSDEKNPAQWRIVFFITAGFYFVGNLVFMLFGTAKMQPWNESTSKLDELDFVKVPMEEVKE